MNFPLRAALAALFAFGVAAAFTCSASAQDEAKPGKKPPPEQMDEEDGKKKKKGKPDGKKDDKSESKKDGEGEGKESKAREPADEKEEKQFRKIRLSVEKQFKKSTKEVIYVYATTEKTYERVEPTDSPSEENFGKGKENRGAAAGAAGGAGQWEVVTNNSVYTSKDREDAIEKVYTFLVEYPPPTPGKKKAKPSADEPPPPERLLFAVKNFGVTKEGEKQAEAYQEQLENTFRREKHKQDLRKQQQKKKGA